MMLMRSLKRGKWIRAAYRCVQPLLPSLPSDCLRSYIRFWKTFVHDRRLNGRAPCALEDIEAQIGDWHATTPLSFYFYQDTWAFRKIVERRPRQHVDIGSTALQIGKISKHKSVIGTRQPRFPFISIKIPGPFERSWNVVRDSMWISVRQLFRSERYRSTNR